MKYFAYVEPGENCEPIEVVVSEQWILEHYWPYWNRQMLELGRDKQISKQACIDDFVVCNWAWEVK